MNILKILSFATVMVLIPTAFADSGIYLHLGCAEKNESCVEKASASDGNIRLLVEKEPRLILNQSNVTEADIVDDDYGRPQLQIQLDEPTKESFRQLTETNNGKILAVVVDDKILISPTITAGIQTGRFVISSGAGDINKDIASIPWLNKMIETKQVEDKQWGLFSILIYLGLGIILISGSVYYAFFRKEN